MELIIPPRVSRLWAKSSLSVTAHRPPDQQSQRFSSNRAQRRQPTVEPSHHQSPLNYVCHRYPDTQVSALSECFDWILFTLAFTRLGQLEFLLSTLSQLISTDRTISNWIKVSISVLRREIPRRWKPSVKEAGPSP